MDMGKMNMNKETAKRELDKELIYNRVFETPIVGMTILDIDQNVVFGNATARKIFELERDPVGVDVREFLNKESKNLVDTVVLPALEKTGSWQGELVGKMKDGREVPLSASCVVIYNEEGRSHAILATYRDITERKQMEGALRESERRYHRLVDTAPDVIYTISWDGTLASLNPAFEKITGWSREEWLNKPFAELVHPDDLAKAVETFQQTMRGDNPLPYELRIRTKSGDYLVGEFTSKPLVEKGEVIGELGIVRNITERKRAEAEYKTIVDTAMDGFWIVDLQGNFLDVNDAYCNLIGYNKDELLNMRISDVEAIENPEDTVRRIKLIMEHGWDRFETRHTRKDGTIVDVEVSTNYLDVDGGRLFVFLRDITERKKAEEALRESEERYRSLVETSPDAVTMTDLEGRVIYVSPQTLELHGFKNAEELVGRSALDIIAPEDREKAMINLQRTLKEGVVIRLEYAFLKKDGTRFIGSLNAALIKDAHGKPKAFIATTRDITERKRVEAALLQSEKKYRTLIENLNEGIWVIDKDAITTFVNSCMAKMLGYTENEMLGKHLFAFMDQRGVEIAKRLLERRKHGVAEEHEFEFLRKDGTRIYTTLETSQLLDDKGNYAGALAAVINITERKKAEERLSQLAAIVESSYDAIIGKTLDGTIVSWNKGAEITYGYKKEEVIGKCVSILAPDDMPDEISSILERIKQGKSIEHYETVRKRKDGAIINISLTVSPIRDEWGNIIGASAIAHDITERKRAEDKLKEYSEKLEEKVKEKTKELIESHKKLVITERLAAIGEVATQVGHDLRNPLTSIKGAAYYLKMDKNVKLEKNAKKMFDTIDDSIAYSDKIITELLEFSQEIKLKPARKTVRDIVTDAISSITVPKKVNVINSTESEPTIRTDSLLIRRALHNVFINAFDAMPDGGTLKIESKKNGENVSIRICDSGVGIPKNVIEKLFTPFFTTKAKGIGLGLAICKRIVEAHGGSISIESKEGKGTCVTIVLPKKQKMNGVQNK
jgi:PAS domain S-box-containing protein